VFRGSGSLATALSLQQLALFRIQATLIGQLVAMGISMVWPVRAAVLLRHRSTARTLLVRLHIDATRHDTTRHSGVVS
jgi:hypothetical protein